MDQYKMNEYEMKETLKVAEKASREIEDYLRSFKETIDVINVENDKRFQTMDVDLLWVYLYNGSLETKKIEVKGDRYPHTGNFFLETHSNREKGTPGCFMYTEADYLYYYFPDTKEVNIMPVKKSREWFIENINRFTEKPLRTKVGDGYYTSAGRLVPKEVMRKEVGIRYKILN